MQDPQPVSALNIWWGGLVNLNVFGLSQSWKTLNAPAMRVYPDLNLKWVRCWRPKGRLNCRKLCKCWRPCGQLSGIPVTTTKISPFHESRFVFQWAVHHSDHKNRRPKQKIVTTSFSSFVEIGDDSIPAFRATHHWGGTGSGALAAAGKGRL